MSENLFTFDEDQNLSEIYQDLVDLVLSTVNGTHDNSYAVFKTPTLEDYYSDSKLVVTHNGGRGGYGLRTVAFSYDDKEGVHVVRQTASGLSVVYNSVQEPIHTQRDSIHLVSALETYYIVGESQINSLLAYLIKKAEMIEKSESLLPGRKLK